MSELEVLYREKVDCPVCELDFEMGKVRTKMVRYSGQDTDLCPIYEGENPLYYDAIVCPYCGFANIGTSFERITRREKTAVKDIITPKWMPRDYEIARTLDQATEAYKIVLLNYQVRHVPASDMAKICMRLGWMYRFKGDSVTEFKYMERAYQYYQDAFSKENLPVGKLDEFSCMYLIGELARRIGHYQESITWFGKLISKSVIPANKDKIPNNIVEMARDQTTLAKKELLAESNKHQE